MSDDALDRQAFLNLCNMSIDTMYELEALSLLLEQKGVLTKQEVMMLATELKRQNPSTESSMSSQPRFTETENAVIEQLMEVILRHDLSADHATELLGRMIQLLEWGKQSAQKLAEANA